MNMKKPGALATALLTAATAAVPAIEAKPADAQIAVSIGIGPGYYGPYAGRYANNIVFDPYCPAEVGVATRFGVVCEAPEWGFGYGFGLWPEFGGFAHGRGFGRPGFDRFYDRGLEGRGGFGHDGVHEREFFNTHPNFGGREGGFSHGGQYQPGNREQRYGVQAPQQGAQQHNNAAPSGAHGGAAHGGPGHR